MGLHEATAARDAGIATAIDHADAVTPAWSERAFVELQAAIAMRRRANPGLTFMAEDVRRFAERRGLPAPPDPRAWGGVLQRAARAGLIVKAGYGESANPQAHLRPTAMWKVV